MHGGWARTARLGQVWEPANALAVAQMPKQLSDSTRYSDNSVESTNSVDYSSLIPLRDRLVGPDVPASSPSHRRSRSMLFTSCLVGVILAGGISAVIAFRQFSLADIWRGRAQLHQPTLTMQGEQAIPRGGHAGAAAQRPVGEVAGECSRCLARKPGIKLQPCGNCRCGSRRHVVDRPRAREVRRSGRIRIPQRLSVSNREFRGLFTDSARLLRGSQSGM